MRTEPPCSLIVVADSDLAFVALRALAGEGRHGLIAQTLAEADLVLATLPAEVMLVDLAIGSEAVLRWLGDIHRLRPELTRRTLVLSGRTPDDAEEDALARCGALPVLLPATAEELRRAIRVITRQSEPPDDRDLGRVAGRHGLARRSGEADG